MEQIALGELGMKVDEFYSMTPRNFINAQTGSRQLYEQNQQAEWERSRWMACVIINPHLKRSVDPKKITTFPWEKIDKVSESVHDMNALLKESEYHDKLIEKKKKSNA